MVSSNKLSDVCIYGVGAVAMLATAVSIMFAYNKISSQIVNKVKSNLVEHMV